MGWLVLLAAVGVAWGVVPLAFVAKQWQRSRRWSRAEGSIVGAKRAREPGSQRRDKSGFRVTYLFRDAMGVERTGQEYRSRKPPKGAPVEVWYDPERPDLHEIMWSGRQWSAITVGLVALAVAGWAIAAWAVAALLGVADPGPLLEPADSPMPF